MRRYAKAFKEQLVDDVDRGASITDVAALNGIPRLTLTRWRREQRKRKLKSGPRSTLAESDWGRLSEIVRSNPTGSLENYCRTWTQLTGVQVTRGAMSRMLTRHGCRKRPPTGCFSRDSHLGNRSNDASEGNGTEHRALS